MATFNVKVNSLAYTITTDDKPCVTWKDEGSVGPCVFWPFGCIVEVRDSGGTVMIGLPYRDRHDDGTRAPLVGEVESWRTRRGAQAVARVRHVPFVEV